MQETRSLGLAAAMLLLSSTLTFAGPCASSIDELQSRLDNAIEDQAAAGPWKPESLGALLNHQPTPRSLASSEGASGRKFKPVLARLDRARAADRAGNLARCNSELAKARRMLDAM